MRKTLFFLLIMMSFGVMSASAGDTQPQPIQVRYALQQLSYQNVLAPDQLNAYLQGADPAEVYLTDGSTLDKALKTLAIMGISKWTVDAGGGAMAGGAFALAGTAGQPDAGFMTGDYDLNGGFWGEAIIIFRDGFETGDTSRWSQTVL